MRYCDSTDVHLMEVHSLGGIRLYASPDEINSSPEPDPCFLVRGNFMNVMKDDDVGFDDTCWVGEDDFFSAAIADDISGTELSALEGGDVEEIAARMTALQSLLATFVQKIDTRIAAMKGRIAARRQGAAAQAATATSPREARATARQAASPSGGRARGRALGRGRGRARGRGMAELMAGDSDEADEDTDFQRVAAAAADAAAEANSDAEEPPHSTGRKRARASM